MVGENGAGKSTLMKILSGVYAYGNYEGEIIYNGISCRFQSISDSEKEGIAIIYQELAQFPELTVYENIFVNHEVVKNRVIEWNETIVQAGKMLRRVGLDVNPTTKIKDLGVGKRQLIEIAKALSKEVQLLILDEPTAALTETESEHLLDLLEELKTQGISCIMISHKLKEIVSIADTITVLRDGRTVCSMDATVRHIAEHEIIRHMVGREIGDIYPKRSHRVSEEVAFEVKNWSVTDPKHNREILHDININVHKGEIVGLAGLMGAGRTELALSLFGNVPCYRITSGEMLINNEQVSFSHPKEAIAKGFSYVTEDRKRNGLILIQDIRFNITIAALKKLVEGLTVNPNEEIRVANDYIDSINIKTPGIQQLVGNLSGGNQQKTSLANGCLQNLTFYCWTNLQEG